MREHYLASESYYYIGYNNLIKRYHKSLEKLIKETQLLVKMVEYEDLATISFIYSFHVLKSNKNFNFLPGF